MFVAVLGCKLCSYVRWGKIHLCDEALWNKTSLAAIYSRSPPPTVFPLSSLQPLFSFTLPLPLSLRVRRCLATCFTSRSRKCSSLVRTHFMWHFFLPCCVWIPSAVCRRACLWWILHECKYKQCVSNSCFFLNTISAYLLFLGSLSPFIHHSFIP